MKFSLTQINRYGAGVWLVTYKPPGESRKRPSFATKKMAEDFISQQKKKYEQTGTLWLAQPAAQRAEALAVVQEIMEAGTTPRVVWEFFKAGSGKKGPGTIDRTLGEAFKEFYAEKVRQCLAPKSLTWYRSGIGRFVSGREALLVRNVTRQDCLDWLANPQWGPRSFNAHRSGLVIFFDWCRESKYREDLPTAGIQAISERRMPDLDEPPAILSLEQSIKLLQATLTLDPGLIRFVAVGLFAGLRPEKEAARIRPEHIRGNLLYVPGKNAKDRQARFVGLTHTLKDGTGSRQIDTLKLWMGEGGDFARQEGGVVTPIINLRRRFETIRVEAGLIRLITVKGKDRKQIESNGWDQDCLRHTFASHYLPVFGADETIKQMGHGDYDMLFGHYRALVTPEEAARYWLITPSLVKDPLKVAELLKRGAS